MAHTIADASGSSGKEADAAAPPRPGLWQGRAAILIGLVRLGITLRHAVTGLSPLPGDVREALSIGTAGATFIGMLPTLCFGAAGFLAPVIVRKAGAESTALLAVALAAGCCRFARAGAAHQHGVVCVLGERGGGKQRHQLAVHRRDLEVEARQIAVHRDLEAIDLTLDGLDRAVPSRDLRQDRALRGMRCGGRSFGGDPSSSASRSCATNPLSPQSS